MAEIVSVLTDIAMLVCMIAASLVLIPVALLLRSYVSQRRKERESYARLCEESIKSQKMLNETNELTLVKVTLLKFNVDLLTAKLIEKDPALRTVLDDFKKIHNLEDKHDGTLLYQAADRNDGADECQPGAGGD